MTDFNLIRNGDLFVKDTKLQAKNLLSAEHDITEGRHIKTPAGLVVTNPEGIPDTYIEYKSGTEDVPPLSQKTYRDRTDWVTFSNGATGGGDVPNFGEVDCYTYRLIRIYREGYMDQTGEEFELHIPVGITIKDDSYSFSCGSILSIRPYLSRMPPIYSGDVDIAWGGYWTCEYGEIDYSTYIHLIQNPNGEFEEYLRLLLTLIYAGEIVVGIVALISTDAGAHWFVNEKITFDGQTVKVRNQLPPSLPGKFKVGWLE